MNDIVKNTGLFVNIMGMSRTSSVQKWDHEAFQRAFRWAHYFEQVYRKTKDKPNIAEKISKQLETLCSDVDVKLGLEPITFNDLPRVSQILRKNLLENPHLSNEFYIKLIGQLKDPLHQELTYKKQLQALSKLKATLQILQLIQKRFEPKEKEETKASGLEEEVCTKPECSGHGSKKSQIRANASLLRKCLLNVIGSDYSSFQRKKHQLHTKLDSMLKHDCGLDVLLSALLLDEEEKFENVSRYILEFIQDILVPKWKIDWKDFLQFPLSNLFGLCSDKHSLFCDSYLDTLTLCGDRLQDLLERHDYMLLMEVKDKDANEQLCKYFFFLLLSHLQKFARTSPNLELKLEELIRRKSKAATRRNEPAGQSGKDMKQTIDSNVWLKLSQELLVSSSI